MVKNRDIYRFFPLICNFFLYALSCLRAGGKTCDSRLKTWCCTASYTLLLVGLTYGMLHTREKVFKLSQNGQSRRIVVRTDLFNCISRIFLVTISCFHVFVFWVFLFKQVRTTMHLLGTFWEIFKHIGTI